MIRSIRFFAGARSVALLGFVLPVLVQAALPVPGAQTEAWLELQRSGQQASQNPQAASAVQREKAAERFLKTYDFAIKESIYGDSFGAGK